MILKLYVMTTTVTNQEASNNIHIINAISHEIIVNPDFDWTGSE
jgi:hypothetical protein